MNFTNLFSWNVSRQHYYCEEQGHLLTGYFANDGLKLFQPMGPSPVDIIHDLSEADPSLEWVRVEEDIARNIDTEEFNVTFDKQNSDYVYLLSDFRTLPGKKFHQKRTFVNRCLKLNPQVVLLDASLASDCAKLNRTWLMNKNDPHDTDSDALEEALLHFDRLSCFGIGVLIDGVLQSFALGEALNSNTFVWHFMKANTDFPGLYQLTHHEFAKKIPDNYLYINMEQDLGIEGLRTAKERWFPCAMVNKYAIAKS